MLSVYERGLAAGLLGIRYNAQGKRRLSTGLRAEYLYDTPARNASHAERNIDSGRSGGDRGHVQFKILPQLHYRPLPELLFYMLKRKIQRLLDKWQPILGVTLSDWDLKKMKLYWGSSSRSTGHITFNTQLAQLPPRFLEYMVVHELVHQLTDGHDAKFYELMDDNLPGWRRMQARIEEPLKRYS